MKNTIQLYQEDLIICDNPKCDYKIKNETGDPRIDTTAYINKPCPLCGENLLTQEDNNSSIAFLKAVDKVNSFFKPK